MAAEEQEMNSKRKINPGSKVYAGFMIFFWYMTGYTWLMSLAISGSESGRETAAGFLISQMLWPIVAILMLIFRIRYRIQNHMKPHPVRFLKEKAIWFRNFLFPYTYGIHTDAFPRNEWAEKAASFREEYKDFYAGGSLSRNVTQMYRHQLMMHRKRLQTLGMEMKTDWERIRFQEEAASDIKQFPDGRMKRALVQEHIRGGRSYIRNGREMFHVKGILGADFDLIGARKAASDANGLTFECPNCGNIAEGKDLTAGCPYCGTSFIMEELQNRVCGSSLFRDPFFDRKLAGLKINGHLNRLAAAAALLQVVACAGLFRDVSINGPVSWIEIPFFILLTVSTALMVFILLLGLNYIISLPIRFLANAVYKARQEKRSEELRAMKKNQEMSEKVRSAYDRDFSLESFLSNVRNKTASVHYAETAEQAEVFSLTDLSGLIERNRSTADCLFGAVALDSFSEQADTWQASVTVNAKLLCLEKGKIEGRTETARIRLERKKNKKTGSPLHLYSLRCGACGSSLDLTKGNTCLYCGKKWDLREHDWCIREYEYM